MEYKNLNKKAINCMYIATFINIAILCAIILIGYFSTVSLIPSGFKSLYMLGLFLLIGLCIVYLAFSPLIRYRRYKYCINDEKIDIIEGLFFITRQIVPIERIHKITTKRGPIDRFFGLAKVIVTTAGGDAVIRFLEEQRADEIAESLKSKINNIVRNQKEVN